MSDNARAALINIGTNRQGSTPPPATPANVLSELHNLGLIGKNNGLTRKGSVKRELIYAELLDTTF